MPRLWMCLMWIAWLNLIIYQLQSGLGADKNRSYINVCNWSSKCRTQEKINIFGTHPKIKKMCTHPLSNHSLRHGKLLILTVYYIMFTIDASYTLSSLSSESILSVEHESEEPLMLILFEHMYIWRILNYLHHDIWRVLTLGVGHYANFKGINYRNLGCYREEINTLFLPV